MSINRFFVFATAIFALGMTATAFGQSAVALEAKGFIGNCPPALGTLYAKFPSEMKELSAKGARACIDTVDLRVTAFKNFKDSEKKLRTVIADEKSSGIDIIDAKLGYITAYAGIEEAQQPMHRPNMEASLKYFDWVAKNPDASEAAMNSYDKWQEAVLEVERIPAIDKKLFEEANLAEAKREKAELEEAKKFMEAAREMMRVDRQMFERARGNKLVCDDGGAVSAKGLCTDGTEPKVIKQ